MSANLMIASGGDMLRITCMHDTSRGQPIMWGAGTGDETGLAFLHVSRY